MSNLPTNEVFSSFLVRSDFDPVLLWPLQLGRVDEEDESDQPDEEHQAHGEVEGVAITSSGGSGRVGRKRE